MTGTQHGSDANRFVPGAWPGCRCGYQPKDNAKLNQHFAEHGFREVDDHGQIIRMPVTRRPASSSPSPG